jgi:hypothetical protein
MLGREDHHPALAAGTCASASTRDARSTSANADVIRRRTAPGPRACPAGTAGAHDRGERRSFRPGSRGSPYRAHR